MPFHFADLLITVIHRRAIDDTRPPPPIPWAPQRPTEIDDLRALFQHGLALLDVDVGVELTPPRTLTEVVALEQHVVAALREIRELKRHLARPGAEAVPDQSDTYDAGPEEKT